MKNERSEKGSGVMKTIVPVAILVILMVVWILVDTQGDKLFADSDDPNLSFYVEETIDLDLYKSYGLPIIIEFGADYCAPCQVMKPIIEELYTELQGKAIILYADLGKYPHIGDGFPSAPFPPSVLRRRRQSLRSGRPKSSVGHDFRLVGRAHVYNSQGNNHKGRTSRHAL